jgi:hypothetical protein
MKNLYLPQHVFLQSSLRKIVYSYNLTFIDAPPAGAGGFLFCRGRGLALPRKNAMSHSSPFRRTEHSGIFS